ncbi:MAG: hypothetical protein U5R48_18180 [Gammaproteobacteria bacterium]|nr:hypothetical protein [Gammaproteobacteria bacterium]
MALEGTYQVGIRDLRTAEAQVLLSTDGVEFRYQWCAFASAERVVCSLRQPGELVPGSGSPFLRYREHRVVREHLVAVDVDGSDVLQLVPRAVTRPGGEMVWNAVDQDEVIAWLPGQPDAVLVQLAREDRVWPSVYRLDIRTNRLRRAPRPSQQASCRWLARTTRDGRRAAPAWVCATMRPSPSWSTRTGQRSRSTWRGSAWRRSRPASASTPTATGSGSSRTSVPNTSACTTST